MNTEIEIPVAQLKSVLPGLSKVVSRSSNLPVLQCVKVELSPDEKTVSLQAHNLDEIATVRLENKANGLSGQMLVPLEMLSKIIKSCSVHQSVRLIASKQETKIRYPVAGSFVDRVLPHTPAEEWPAVKVVDQAPTAMDAAMRVGVKEAMECASIDSSRYVLNGVCLDVRDKDAHYVVGTDGRHLYSANTFTFNLPEHLIIPSTKFMVWPAFAADGPWQLRMLPAVKPDEKEKDSAKKNEEPPWFRIDSDHWTYQAKAIDGQFPSWKQVMPGDTTEWTSITLQPSAVNTILDALPLLPGNEETDRAIRLAVGNGLLIMARGRDQTDWTRINVPDVTVIGKSVEVALNRGYLLKALRFGLHQIQILDSLSPLILTAPGKTMIVMPIRMQDPSDPAPTPAKSANGAQPISQNENTPVAPPSAPGVNHTTEKTEQIMPMATTMTAPERGNIRAQANGSNGQEESGETRSTFKAALEHIDRIKTNLKDIIGDLNDALSMLKTVEKEQKASSKEIEVVRAKLREIQSVEI